MEGIKTYKENKTRYALLGILTVCECTGYDMKKIMENSLLYFWSESFGQIYPTLKKMEEERLVKSKEQVVGQKTRYLYSITPLGKKVLQDWLALPPAPEVIRNELLLKLFFSQPRDRQTVLEHLARQKQRVIENLEVFTATRQQVSSAKDPSQLFRVLTLEYGLRTLRAELDWLEYAEQRIADLCL